MDKNIILKMNLYFPYISFDECEYKYKKIAELNEIEAIIMSFIFVNKSFPSNFIKTFSETFNLKDWWEDFIFEILIKMINSNIIETNQEIDKDLLCSDLNINSAIESKLINKEFVGLDEKIQTKKYVIHKSLFSCLEDEKLILYDNKNMEANFNEFNTKKLSKKIDNDFYEDFLSKEFYKKIENGSNIIIKIKLNKKVVFHYFNCDIKINIGDNKIFLSSDSKNINEYFNELINYDSQNIVFKSLKKHLYDNVKNIEFKHLYDSESEFIDFDKYHELILKTTNFNYYDETKNIFIENDAVFELVWKEYDLFLINENNKNEINLLHKIFYKSLDNFIIDNLKKDKYLKEMIILIKNSQNNNSINKFLLSKDKYLIDFNYSEYKDYLVSKVLINDNLQNELIEKLLYSNNININDWLKILTNNPNSITSFLRRVTIELVNRTENLLFNKIILSCLQFNINLLTLDNINTTLSNLNNELELLYESKYDIIKLKSEFENIKAKINENSFNNIDIWFKDIYQKINSKINVMEEESYKNLNNNCMELSKLLDSIVEEINNATNVNFSDFFSVEKELNDKDLKKWFMKIRIYRNNFIHNKLKIEKSETKKILENQKIINEYISWLNENKDKIKNEIISNSSKRKK